MRALVTIVAACHALNVFVLAKVIDASLSGGSFTPVYVTLFLAGLAALALALFIPWRRALAGLAGAIVLSFVLGTGGVDETGVMGTLVWGSFTIPLAAIIARPTSRVALGAAACFGLVALLSVPAFVIARYNVTWASYDPPVFLMATLILASEAGFALLIMLAAMRGPLHAERRTAPTDPPLLVLIAGAGILAISWALGGTLIYMPIGGAGVVLIVAAALLRARRSPAFAAGTLLLALLGFAPAGSCIAHSYSDDGSPPHDGERPASLFEIGANGPSWSRGGGTGGTSYSCTGAPFALGLGWTLALLGAATITVLRRGRAQAAPIAAG